MLTVGARRVRSVANASVVAAVIVLLVPGHGFKYAAGWASSSIYDWAALVLVALAGLGLMLGSDGAALTAVAGAALAGTGVVAVRRWYTAGGFGVGPAENLDLVRVLAGLLAIAGLVLAVTGLQGVRRLMPCTARAVVVAMCAAVTAFLAPLLFGTESYSTATQLGSYVLMYGLPWALAVILVGLAERRAAFGGLVAASVHMVCLAFDRWPMITMRHRHWGLAVAAVCLAVAAASRRWPVRAVGADATDQSTVTLIDDGSTVTGLTK